MDAKSIWNVVRKLKKDFLFQSCNTNTRFLNVDSIKSEVDLFEQFLQGCEDGSCDKLYANFTNDQLKTPAEMFLYMVSCSDTLKPWFKFYKDLFHSYSSEKIVLTVNKILKSTDAKKNKKLNDIAAEIFRRLEVLFSLKLKNDGDTEIVKGMCKFQFSYSLL